jgi:uncharacterized Zn-binding protein involved in type VI secretion
MADKILVHGDIAAFQSAFGAASVTVLPGTLTGTGPVKIGGKPVCVVGDERSVVVTGCPYTTATHTIPGAGTLKIKALAGAHEGKKTRREGAAVLLLGAQFDAVFEVTMPAHEPPKGAAPPVPDTAPPYDGKGEFVASNDRVKGT